MTDRNEIEPYQPKEPARRPPPPPPQPAPTQERRMGGCTLATLIMLMTLTGVCVLAMVVIGALAVSGISSVGNTTTAMIEALDNLFGDKTVEVDVQRIVLGFRSQAFLETVREQDQIELRAEDTVRIGDVIPLPADRALSYRAFITITAGIDLRMLDAGDFEFDGETMIITIPQPQLKDCILDTENSVVYDRNLYCSTVGTCRDLEDLLRAEALHDVATEGTEEILAHALTNAQEEMTNLAVQFGYEQVELRVSDEVIPLVAVDGTCLQTPLLEPTPTPVTP